MYYLVKCKLWNIQSLRLAREMMDALFMRVFVCMSRDVYTSNMNDAEMSAILIPFKSVL